MSRVLGVGEKFPEFAMKACVGLEKGKEFKEISSNEFKGKWNVVFFWPLDFTFICPTEIVEFNNEYKNFKERGANLYGASNDSQYVHLAWRNAHPELKNLQFPMLADT